jgi:hypothetical protein
LNNTLCADCAKKRKLSLFDRQQLASNVLEHTIYCCIDCEIYYAYSFPRWLYGRTHDELFGYMLDLHKSRGLLG